MNRIMKKLIGEKTTLDSLRLKRNMIQKGCCNAGSVWDGKDQKIPCLSAMCNPCVEFYQIGFYLCAGNEFQLWANACDASR